MDNKWAHIFSLCLSLSLSSVHLSVRPSTHPFLSLSLSLVHMHTNTYTITNTQVTHTHTHTHAHIDCSINWVLILVTRANHVLKVSESSNCYRWTPHGWRRKGTKFMARLEIYDSRSSRSYFACRSFEMYNYST